MALPCSGYKTEVLDSLRSAYINRLLLIFTIIEPATPQPTRRPAATKLSTLTSFNIKISSEEKFGAPAIKLVQLGPKSSLLYTVT